MKLSQCDVRVTIDVIRAKWKPIIVNALKPNPLRFGELLREIPEATRKVATEQLKELEADGVVLRNASGKRWDGVEYSLSDYGRTLVPVLALIAEWGQKHRARKQIRRPTPVRSRSV